MGCCVLQEERGQMTVELAVLLPVVIVVALICFNALRFAELVARFDRVAPDAVLVQGVSPAGSPEGLAGVDEVRSQINAAMPEGACEVQVSLETLGAHEAGAIFNLAAGSVRYVCSMSYKPWPASVSIAGASYSLPLELEHKRSFVVDKYRAGIIT